MAAAFRRFLAKTSGVLFYMIQYGCITHCTLEYVGDFVFCEGSSMEPTIRNNDIVLTEHISVFSKSLHRGDVVIARSPTNPNIFICKRVAAMEGDSVFNSSTQSFKVIPRGHVWLEGDNKGNSTDSREYGPIPYGLLRSRVFYKILPLVGRGSISLPLDT